jgi:hypothetical protein
MNDVRTRVGKVLWVSMGDLSPKPYLCVEYANDRLENRVTESQSIVLVSLEEWESCAFLLRDIEMLKKKGSVWWDDER